MREIKFRGKSLLDGRWIYGFYYSIDDGLKGKKRHIIVHETKSIGLQTRHDPIDIGSLGQYTGKKDIKGKEVYGGSSIHAKGHYPGEGWYDTGEHWFDLKDTVKWDDKRLVYVCGGYLLSEIDRIKIIKNI